MLISFKAVRVAVCVFALVFVGWRFILPLDMMYIGGLGVKSPLPKRVVTAYPKLSLYLFILGGPIVFLALLIALIWVVR